MTNLEKPLGLVSFYKKEAPRGVVREKYGLIWRLAANMDQPK